MGDYKTEIVTSARWEGARLLITQVTGPITAEIIVTRASGRLVIDETRPGLGGGELKMRGEYRLISVSK